MRSVDLRVTLATLCYAISSVAMAAECQPPEFEGVAIERTQESKITLRSVNGSTHQVQVAAALADTTAPGALVKLKRSSDCSSVTAKETPGGTLAGEVVERADDGSRLLLRTAGPRAATTPTWKLPDVLEEAASAPKNSFVSLEVEPTHRPVAKTLHAGDHVAVGYRCSGKDCPEGPDKGATLLSLEWRKMAVSALAALATLLGCALGLLLLAALVVRGAPWRLAVGQDNRYSTSKFQTLVWFWVVLSAYLAINVQRLLAGGLDFLGGVDIPTNLLVLSGISVLTFAAAKAITTSKVETAQRTHHEVKQEATEALMSDLVRDDTRQLDLGDFQVTVLTVLAALFYLGLTIDFLATVELRHQLSMPDLDSTWLGLLGLGHAGYLGKKAASGADVGMSAPQAVQKAQELLASIRADATRSSAALTRATDAHTNGEVALKASATAVDRAAAQPEADRVEAAAADAKAAAAEAAAAGVKAAENTAAIERLRAAWAQDPGAGTPITAALSDAAKLSAATKADVELAQKWSDDAEKNAASAVQVVSRKPS